MNAIGALSTVTTACALAVLPGCGEGPPLPPPPIVWTGDHVRFGTNADVSELCAGTLPYLDGVAGYLGEVFERSPNNMLDYYWMPDGLAGYCRNPTTHGCVSEQGTFSLYAVHQHELVHAVRYPNLLYLPLEEGLAEAYGDDWDLSFGLEADINSVLEDPGGFSPNGYTRAGHFSSYLREEYGPGALAELNDQTDYTDNYEVFERAFAPIYGKTVAEVITEYEAEYVDCTPGDFRDRSFECTKNVIVAPTDIDEPLELELSMACDDPAVLGPRRGVRWRTLTLEIRDPGRYFISTTLDEGVSSRLIRVKSCQRTCFDLMEDELSTSFGSSVDGEFCLAAGRYLFKYEVDEPDEATYYFYVSRTSTVDCQ